MGERFHLYVKATSNYPPGLALQTFERLGPEWEGERLSLPFWDWKDSELRTLEVVGWDGLFATGHPCAIHVARVRWLPQRGGETGQVSSGPSEPVTGYLVWGGNSGVRIMDPEAEPQPGAEHLPPGVGQPLLWIEDVDELPTEVRLVVAPAAHQEG